MNTLIETIERVDPGHFDRRHNYLLKVSKAAEEMGFYPLEITQKDIQCYWIRIETVGGKGFNLTVEMFDDIKFSPSLLNLLKEVAKYKNPTKGCIT